MHLKNAHFPFKNEEHLKSKPLIVSSYFSVVSEVAQTHYTCFCKMFFPSSEIKHLKETFYLFRQLPEPGKHIHRKDITANLLLGMNTGSLFKR